MADEKKCRDFGTEKHAHCKDLRCKRRIQCIEKYLKGKGVL